MTYCYTELPVSPIAVAKTTPSIHCA